MERTQGQKDPPGQPSPKPSPSSRRHSEEVVDAEWTEVREREVQSGPDRPPAPPIDLAVRARDRSRRGQKGRNSPHGYLPRVSVSICFFCRRSGAIAIPVLGPLSVPVCARCARLGAVALNLLR
jgi:hypothetical protein